MARAGKRSQVRPAAPIAPPDRWEAIAYRCAVACLWAVALLLDPAGRESFRLPKAIGAETLALASLLALALAGRLVVSRALLQLPAVRAVLPLAFAALLAGLASPHREHVLRALPGLAVALLTLAGWSAGFGAARLRATWLWWTWCARGLRGFIP